MRKLLLALVATVAIAGGLLPRVSVAQSTSAAFSQTGLLTSLSSPPIIAVPLNPPATCTLIVSGTFVGTVTFDESADGGQTYPTILGTATAAGTQVFSCNGYYTFRARFTAYTSGAAQVNITTASVGSGSGGGGGGTAQISPLPLPVAPTGGPYQITAASPIPNVAVNGTTTPVTITNACGTPTTPSACVANNSAAIFDLGQNGSSDYSYQINTISGATLAFYTSNDGVNFFAANLTISGSGPSALGFATSTQVAGKFSGIGGTSRYAAIVATVAPTSAITVYPYLGSHSSAVSVHAAVPLTIASLPPVTIASQPAQIVASLPPVTIAGGNVTDTIANPDPTASPGSSTAPVLASLKKTNAVLTTTALGASGVFTSSWIDTTADNTTSLDVDAYSAVGSGTLVIQQSNDVSGTLSGFPIQISTSSVSAAAVARIQANVTARYWRVVYTNSSTAQTTFEIAYTASGATPSNFQLCDASNIWTCAQIAASTNNNVTTSANALTTDSLMRAANTGGGKDRVTVDSNSSGVLRTENGGATATKLTSASATTCTSLSEVAGGRAVRIVNSSSTAQSATLTLFDDSGTCVAADQIYQIVLGASQIVDLQIPLGTGLSYTLSAALTNNIVVTRN